MPLVYWATYLAIRSFGILPATWPEWPFTGSLVSLHPATTTSSSRYYHTFIHAEPTKVHEDIGRGNFLALYLSSGVIGSISSLWFHVLKQRFTSYHFGASGAVWGIMMAWAVLTATYV